MRSGGPHRTARSELVTGGLLVAFGILLTWYTHAFLTARVLYVFLYGPIVVGIAVVVRGALQLARERPGHYDLGKQAAVEPIELQGLGFKSFIALRYLMAYSRRLSRVVFAVLLFCELVGAASLVAEKLVLHHILSLDHDQLELIIKIIAGCQIGSLILALFTLIIGGLRYVFSFFTTVPLVGVWIGTGALVCVLSVMSGFESDLREKILGSNAHIQVTKDDGELTDWHAIKARIDAIPGVVASTPYALSEVVIAANNNGQNVIIKGIDPKTVGNVTELVRDLEDKDAMKRLDPLVVDVHDLGVPQTPRKPGGLDPPPPDLPSSGDPIDFSQPTGSDDPGSDADLTPPPPPPPAGSAVDPPPPDLIATDEPPIDYSDPGSGLVDPAVHVIDVPIDQPMLSRRTQSLPGILVGRELVKQTHLYTGEEVRVVSPLSDPSNPDATGTPIPFNRDYRVAGIFFTGMYEYDLKYVYVTLDSLDDFLDRGDAVDGIEVRVGSPDDTDAYVQRISTLLGPEYRVQDWKELNRSLFSALKLEKIAMFLVLGIVILVASFSIVGNLIMVVVEKAREIALLKTLGASDTEVMQVFAIQGLLIGAIGTVLGVTTGLAACWAGKRFGIPLNPDVYYIDRMPVHVELNSVLVTAAAGVLISIAATFYPALLAARVRPAAGMRH